jgi:PAS domain S-box-containing protein
MGFRGKQIATLTLVAGVVALVTSLMNAALLTRLAVNESKNRLELLASAFYHQTSRVIRSRPGEDLREVLSTDPSLRAYTEAVVGYSPTTLYLAITDTEDVVILHNDPSREGELLSPAEPVSDFLERNGFSQFWALSRGNRVFELELPFTVDEEPFGAIRVAISTLLLKEQLSGAITSNALLAAGVVLVSFLASFYLANRLLAPIEMLRRELARIDPGGGEPPLELRNEADVSRITEFFATLSKRLAEDRQLRESGSGWLETMMGGLTDAVMVVSSERKILTLNDSASQLLGHSRAESQGKLLDEIVPPEHPISALVMEALVRGEPVGPRSVALEVQGREVPHSLTVQMLRETNGVSGVLVSARNLERLSQLGAHLSYSQKLSALGRLTSGVAHEIKNPLNAMVIHVALLRQKLESAAPDARGYLDVLDEQIRRLDRVIQGFLKFTRPEELHLDAVPLEGILMEVLQLVSGEAQKNGIRVVREIPSDLPPVHGDRELLQQAFLNLMLNAKDAMPGGGTLKVAAQRSIDGYVEIEVEDNGVGISPSELPKIFDLYYTTKEAGSGIGLSLVYRIIQLHDGEVEVHSTPKAGTRFTIKLPEVRG